MRKTNFFEAFTEEVMDFLSPSLVYEQTHYSLPSLEAPPGGSSKLGRHVDMAHNLTVYVIKSETKFF